MNDDLQTLLDQRDELNKKIIKARYEQRRKNEYIYVGDALLDKKAYMTNEGIKKYYYSVTMTCESRGQYAQRQLTYGESLSEVALKLRNFLADVNGLYKELMLREFNYVVKDSDFYKTPEVYAVDFTDTISDVVPNEEKNE